SEDQHIRIFRNGRLEDVYWTFGYSPVKNDNGGVDGVLVVCHETTEKILAQKKSQEANRRFYTNVMQAPVAMCVLRGRSFVVEIANERVLEIWGKRAADVMYKPIFDGLPEVRNQGLEELLENVYTTGETFTASERPVDLPRNGRVETRYLNFVYQPLREPGGGVTGIMAVANDVTDQVKTRQAITDLEERWRLAIDASGVGTFDWNMKNDDLLCSPRFFEIFGFPNEVDYQTTTERIHPDDVGIHAKAHLVALQTGKLEYECRIVRSDGAIVWIRADGKVYRDADGVPKRMLGTLKDITQERAFSLALEQKVQERTRELLEEKQLAEAILDASVDIVSVFDCDMRYLAANKTTERKYNIAREDLIGRRMHDLFPQTVNGALYKNIQRTFDGETPEPFRHTSLVNGRQYQTSVVPLKQNGAVTAVLAIAHDYTDLYDASEQIRVANEMLALKNKELENMNNELASFAYVASHDLQEPLRKIQMFSNRILAAESFGDKSRDYFTRMQSAAARMQKLIEDLLAYSRTNTAERSFETVDPAEAVAAVFDEMSDTVRAANAVVDVDIDCVVSVIPFQFHQLLSNLIGNSLKFASPGRPVHIRITGQVVKSGADEQSKLSPGKTYCRIRIADNGIGFEPQYRERIFEVFQRLHGRAEHAGTGIGLAICKKIVENHGGVITANGEPGEGAVFDVFLPV
ncbi:MAG TPA: PAS domain-containing protein, partial [Chitinophagales bacterium]|nr:PAS domain-containing protein [Chitinophagales bacterium]